MKIDRYLGDISKRLDSGSFSYFSSSLAKEKEEQEQGLRADPNDKSWLCRFCHKRHFELGDCPNQIYGDGDRFCNTCEKVHYDNAECPNGVKWCFYCGGQYLNEDEHFTIHEQNPDYNRFIKENPSWASIPSWAIDRASLR